jgi:putative membrane protein
MRLTHVIIAASAALGATTASAKLPEPPMSAAPRQAQPFLFHAGASDVFEITTSMIALQRSQNPAVRAYASMLIDHHTRMTSTALANAKAAGIAPPPPILDARRRALITQLLAQQGSDFDRTYLTQQVPAHQEALALMTGYASGGDVPTLRQTAAGAVPTVQAHLTQAQALLASAR